MYILFLTSAYDPFGPSTLAQVHTAALLSLYCPRLAPVHMFFSRGNFKAFLPCLSHLSPPEFRKAYPGNFSVFVENRNEGPSD